MPKPGQHVIPDGSRWSVRRAGSAKASAIFETRQDAIAHAQSIARNQGTEVYIHGRDGRIQERHDPRQPAA